MNSFLLNLHNFFFKRFSKISIISAILINLVKVKEIILMNDKN